MTDTERAFQNATAAAAVAFLNEDREFDSPYFQEKLSWAKRLGNRLGKTDSEVECIVSDVLLYEFGVNEGGEEDEYD